MIDTIVQWISSLAGVWDHYTDLCCMLIGAICGWSVAAIVEAYFVPANWDVRRQKGMTVLVTIMVSWLAAALMWWATDPLDPWRFRIIITGVLSPISPFGYVWVGRLLTKYFPAIGSVWSLSNSPSPATSQQKEVDSNATK